jgi:hypothetical protein
VENADDCFSVASCGLLIPILIYDTLVGSQFDLFELLICLLVFHLISVFLSIRLIACLYIDGLITFWVK